MTKHLIRQGDLVIATIDAPPLKRRRQAKAITLAVGEESGHSHVLDAVLRDSGIFEVVAPTTLRVEGQPWRHDPIPVEPGVYRFFVQRQLSEDEEVIRVAD